MWRGISLVTLLYMLTNMYACSAFTRNAGRAVPEKSRNSLRSSNSYPTKLG